MITYLAGSGTEEIILTDPVLEHFATHRQLQSADREAGGQLFASFETGVVRIELATGPGWSDFRTRFFFMPNKWVARADIRRNHKLGLHYVGDWHTHPERYPSPSGTDHNSMHDMFRKSKHDLASFLMIIVGTEPPPEGLFVAVFQAETHAILHPK